MESRPAERIKDELRVAMFRNRISQSVASEVSGLSKSAVARRLSGDVPMTIDDLEALAAVVHLDVEINLVPTDAESEGAA